MCLSSRQNKRLAAFSPQKQAAMLEVWKLAWAGGLAGRYVSDLLIIILRSGKRQHSTKENILSAQHSTTAFTFNCRRSRAPQEILPRQEH